MLTLFMLVYEFPPLNHGGTQRPLKFAKYLPESGIRPVVFTLDPADYTSVFLTHHRDEAIRAEVPPDMEVHYTRSNRIVVPDRGRISAFLSAYLRIVQREAEGWRPHLIPVFDAAVSQHRPDALYVTAPPFSLAPFGVELAARHRLPLILDLRDAWSQWNTSPYGSFAHYQLTLRAEERCLCAAQAVITTSDQTADDLRRLHPRLPAERLHVITNGYDRDVPDWTPVPRISDRACFKIGYVGSFYYSPQARSKMLAPRSKKRGHRMLQYVPRIEDWLYRSPHFAFQAVRTLLDRRADLAARLRLCFAGEKPDWFDAMVSEFALEQTVHHVGRITHEESLAFQESCDALLLTSSKVIGGQDYSIAGKTFEYITMRKPIVAFVCEGAQKRLIEQTGLAAVCDPDNPKDSARTLEAVIDGTRKFEPNRPFLETLHRRNLTARLAAVVRQAVPSAK